MIFFADEGLDVPLVVALREKGYAVVHAFETMQGASDEAVLAAAVSSNAVLLAKDKDFGEIVIKQTLQCKGVVLIRVEKLNNNASIEAVVGLLSKYEQQLSGHFTVIQDDKIRIRKLE